jgi:hypothetical protein
MSKLTQAVKSVSLPPLDVPSAPSSAPSPRAAVGDYIRLDALAGEMGVHQKTLKRRSEDGTFPPIFKPVSVQILMVRRDHYEAWLRGECPWRKS